MEKIEMEFMVRSSTPVLYDMLSTPSGLSEWFADDVNIKDDIYTFIWDNSEEQAQLLKKKKGEYIRFHWVDHEEDDTYFEMRIKTDPMTGEVAVIVTDFADEEDVEETRELWESQISDLAHRLGG
ncbi:MAG: START-like domain-containing protein [Luteibaculum sp.]